MAEQKQSLDALIVGAGFAGLYMLHRLRERGFSAHVVEAGQGVGGTWYWNRYPGARCDVPSVEYSYSFSPELERDWRWTERYAAQPEILAYLEHVAERFDLTRDIRFETKVTRARWDETALGWNVETAAGRSYHVRHLILATGALSEPRTPDLPGLETFAGQILHTAKWDGRIALAGKRVALFGTGSSGIQVTPQIARIADHLTIFQRTPNFAVPAGNHPLSEGDIVRVAPYLPAKREAARRSALGFFDARRPGSAKAADPDARIRRFEEQWAAGTTGLLLAYEDLLIDEESNAHVAAFARDKIAQLVTDPDTARKATPQGYPLGARRLCSEIGFYDALNQDNVTLVDVREEPVTEISAHGIRTAKGDYPADIVIFATGFDAVIGAIKAIDINGCDGRSLRDDWADGPRAYLGLAVAGFPNLFTITGPGSPSVLSNVVLSIEQHVEWIEGCLSYMRTQGIDRIEATEAAEAAWMDHTDAIAQQTLFPRADSWYHGRTRDGRKVFMPYLGGCGAYRDACDTVAADDYRGFHLGGK
jgi:cyclohexanone monooxygenase